MSSNFYLNGDSDSASAGADVEDMISALKVMLVVKDGTVLKTDIPAPVTSGQITTFVTEFPIEIEDHLLRQLPNGMVEDFIVSDPGYHSEIAGAIPPTYQIKVREVERPLRHRKPSLPIFTAPTPE
ncbi:hypothetical protein NLM16_16370 [Bradyrhizobium brasilense]|uniref:hypothetical protein n=1 Tax=Bradyrhizobium brasilense TaxID=1419277 RepID=UPI00287744E5|nr:hypothetical protein [Bradyrhizobium brasilense]MCP3415687.1 hypothetical protein [Bradyrhizobium brasilense]